MKLLVIGSGGREHAIILKLKENPKVKKIFALPGNGGMRKDAICVKMNPTNIEEVKQFAIKEKIDFAIVTPDDPLVLGMVDVLEEAGIKTFGPTKAAAMIEGSKSFSKDLMKKYQIPTASYEIFDNIEEAKKYIKKQKYPLVIKADGLALGKGVIICNDIDEANSALNKMMNECIFGSSGKKVVIEEFLEGVEVSLLTFTDGKTLVPMVSSMDHKRIGNNDQGLNTGGMGAIAPNPFYTSEIEKKVMDEILIPTIKAMRQENRIFKGCLYFGLMITKEGPKVIEYNCRFGDPETQVILPLLESDLLNIMLAIREETLHNMLVKFSDKFACCVIMASNGYPKSYHKGYKIAIDDDFNAKLYVAGASFENNHLVTSGGRVLGVTAVSKSLDEAIKNAYQNVNRIHFENAYYRSDIGMKALKIIGDHDGL